MSEHVGYDKHAPVGRNGANSRNGTRTKCRAHYAEHTAAYQPVLTRGEDRHADAALERILGGEPYGDRVIADAPVDDDVAEDCWV